MNYKKKDKINTKQLIIKINKSCLHLLEDYFSSNQIKIK